MISELFLILMGGILFIVIVYLDSKHADAIEKSMDESCYYCIYSTTPHSIRDSSKNTCKKINNQNWTSTQIRNCKYRVKE